MKGSIGKIHLDPYGSVCWVYVDQEAFIKHRKIDPEFVKACGGVTTYTEDHNEYHVLIHENSINTLAHECLHVTISLLRHRGVQLSSKSEESYTYLHGHLVNEMYGIICRYKDKQQKAEEAKKQSEKSSKPASGAEGEGIKQGAPP